MAVIDPSSADGSRRRRRQAMRVAFSLAAAVTSGGCVPDGNGPSARAVSPDPSTTTLSASPSSGGPITTSGLIEPPAPTVPAAAPGPGAEAPSAVRSVTDGDTLVLADGRRVRLAQVDAPESGACFGSQATQALRALVEGREVTVRRPENGPERDRYGRTLGEVSVEGRSVNEALVRSGAAGWYEEFAHEDTGLAARLQAAEAEAKAASIGQWSTCSSPASAAVAPAAQPPAAAQAPGSPCHPAYLGGCIPPGPPDLDCGDIGRRIEVDRTHGDPHRLDADGDGWGCETKG